MKLFIIAAILIVNTNSAFAGLIERSVYTADCRHAVPLTSYERCDEYSHVGDIVARCAMDQAIDNCRAEKNFDCVKVSVKITEKSSVEFPGLKSCTAVARAHGYGF